MTCVDLRGSTARSSAFLKWRFERFAGAAVAGCRALGRALGRTEVAGCQFVERGDGRGDGCEGKGTEGKERVREDMNQVKELGTNEWNQAVSCCIYMLQRRGGGLATPSSPEAHEWNKHPLKTQGQRRSGLIHFTKPRTRAQLVKKVTDCGRLAWHEAMQATARGNASHCEGVMRAIWPGKQI